MTADPPWGILPAMLNGPVIRQRRLKLGLTLAAAAKLAKMGTAQKWARMETGERTSVSLETLVRVSDALGCKVDALLIRKRK